MPTPGIVVSIRLNPQDVMSCIDVADKIGVPKDGMSLNQVAKIALASSLEAFRQNGAIPRREGFEYTEMLAPFKQPAYSGHAAKLRRAIDSANTEHERIAPVVPESAEHKRKRARYDELVFKNANDPLNVSDEEQVELAALVGEFQT